VLGPYTGVVQVVIEICAKCPRARAQGPNSNDGGLAQYCIILHYLEHLLAGWLSLTP
jgi:hypothetical protein